MLEQELVVAPYVEILLLVDLKTVTMEIQAEAMDAQLLVLKKQTPFV